MGLDLYIIHVLITEWQDVHKHHQPILLLCMPTHNSSPFPSLGLDQAGSPLGLFQGPARAASLMERSPLRSTLCATTIAPSQSARQAGLSTTISWLWKTLCLWLEDQASLPKG